MVPPSASSNLPELALVGAGEGAALVAEELGLEELEGEGGAVDLDEGALAAGGAVVDGAGDELLADAGLAPDEDGGIGVGDLIDHFLDGLHARAVLEHPVVLGAASLELASEHLLSETLDLPLQRGLLQHVFDRAPDVVLMERLGQEVARALLHRLDHDRRFAVGRDHDHGRPRAGFPDALQEREAVFSPQADIEEDHRRLQFLRPSATPRRRRRNTPRRAPSPGSSCSGRRRCSDRRQSRGRAAEASGEPCALTSTRCRAA